MNLGLWQAQALNFMGGLICSVQDFGGQDFGGHGGGFSSPVDNNNNR